VTIAHSGRKNALTESPEHAARKKASRIARVIVLAASHRDEEKPYDMVPTLSVKDAENRPLAMSDM